MFRAVSLAFLAVLCVGGDAWSAVWPLPNNVKVVEKGGNGKETYPTVQAALAAVTDAGPTNRYLIKVMPGRFLSTAASPIVLKPYVDIEGSGEASEITSTIGVAPGEALWPDSEADTGPSSATIVVPEDVVASSAKLSNIAVTNTSNTGGVAVLAKGKVVLEHVAVAITAESSDWWHCYCGVLAEGAAADVTVHGGSVAVENRGLFGHVTAVGAFRLGRVAVIGTDVRASGGEWTSAVSAGGMFPNVQPGTMEVRVSTLRSTPSANAGGVVVQCDTGFPNSTLRIYGSKLTMGSASGAVSGGCGVVSNSEVFGSGAVPSSGAFVDSMIDTPLDPEAKVRNCWNTLLEPIPGQ